MPLQPKTERVSDIFFRYFFHLEPPCGGERQEGFGVPVVIGDVALDGVFEVGDRCEDAAPDAPPRDGGKEAFDRIQPGGRGGREVKHPSGMVREPLIHLGMLMGSIIVENDMDDLADLNLPLHGIEEGNELLMAMAFHAAANHRTIEHVQGGEQCRGSVALVIVGHGRAFAGLQRQARLGAIERLDLAFLVDGQHHRVAGRVHVKANRILDFFKASPTNRFCWQPFSKRARDNDDNRNGRGWKGARGLLTRRRSLL